MRGYQKSVATVGITSQSIMGASFEANPCLTLLSLPPALLPSRLHVQNGLSVKLSEARFSSSRAGILGMLWTIWNTEESVEVHPTRFKCGRELRE